MVEANVDAVLARRAREALLISDVAAMLVRERDATSTFDVAVAHIASSLDLPYVRLWLRSAHGDTFTIAGTAGPAADGAPDLALDVPRLLTRSVPTSTAALGYEPFVGGDRFAELLGMRAFVALPLVAQGRTLGLLVAFGWEAPPAHTLQTLRTVADALTLAVSRQHARSEIAALGESLDAVTHGISHDLRAPVRHVSGFVDLLRRHLGEGLDAKASRYADTISDAAKHMHTLIESMVEFSRAGRAPMHKRSIDTDALVRDVLAELLPRSEGRRVNTVITNLPRLHGDPTLMRIVFARLLANALKFSARASEIVIEVGSEPAAEGRHVVFVRDNGIGFDMAYAGRLFSPFQRLHASDDYDGAGMGLALVKRIVDRHDGTVRAASAEGLGATFFIDLPGPPASASDSTVNHQHTRTAS